MEGPEGETTKNTNATTAADASSSQQDTDVAFTDDDDFFGHLGKGQDDQEKQSKIVRPPPPVPGTMAKQYSNLIEGESDNFAGLARYEDDGENDDGDSDSDEGQEEETKVEVPQQPASPQVVDDQSPLAQQDQVRLETDDMSFTNQETAAAVADIHQTASSSSTAADTTHQTATTSATTSTNGEKGEESKEVEAVTEDVAEEVNGDVAQSTTADQDSGSPAEAGVAVAVQSNRAAEDNPTTTGSQAVDRGTVGYYAADQFKIHSTIGKGTYGQVYLVSRNGVKFALKKLDKGFILKYNKSEAVFRERDIGKELSDHCNVVEFYGTFQDEDSLYFLLDYCPYGSLQDLLKHVKTLPSDLARFYAAQIVSALEFMHGKGICHRDLKPGNILIDNRYSLQLTDFGDSKMLDPELNPYERLDEPENEHDFEADRNSLFEEQLSDDERGTSRQSMAFVGTALYVSPEMIEQTITSPGMDLWALGCMIFEMRVGQTPFHGNVEAIVFAKIQERNITFPNELQPEEVEIIDMLLQKDPRARLGAGPPGSSLDFDHLKSHAYFSGINFDTLEQTSPPIPADRFVRFFEDHKAKKETISMESAIFNDFKNKKPAPQVAEVGKPGGATNIPRYPNTKENILMISSTSSLNSQKRIGDVIFSGVVQKGSKKRKWSWKNARCRNMILEHGPRLYFTSTLQDDGKEGRYLSDIILFNDLKVSTNKDVLIIKCPHSTFTYQLRTSDAEDWRQHIQQAIIEKDFEENNMLMI